MSVINQITVENTTYDVNDKRVTWSNSVSVQALSETVTIYNVAITATSVVEPFIDDGTPRVVPYSYIYTSLGSVTLGFPPLTYNSTIRVRITNL